MTKVPYVQRFEDRHGHVRFYFRRPGFKRAALPDPKDVKAFFDAYSKANSPDAALPAKQMTPRYVSGTMGALISEYLTSAEFKALKPNSRKAYQYVIRRLQGRKSVAMPVSHLRRAHILRLRDELADTPGAANLVLSVVAVLMRFAIDRDYRDDNPAAGIRRFKGGTWRSWTDHELAAFEKKFPPGTMAHLAFTLALYTGQRRGDLAAMDLAHRKGGRIRVIQEKTGAELWIPEHTDLAATLNKVPRKIGPILVAEKGKRFSADRLGAWFAEKIDEAGLPDDCVLHGLRKTAARRLAEAGCSTHEIMAITGHKSLGEVERYTRDTDKGRTGLAAISKLELSTRKSVNPTRASD